MIYCQLQMLIIDYSLKMFRASLCLSSGEKTTCYCIWSIFAGSVGYGSLRYCSATLRVWALWRLLFEKLRSQWSHPQRSTTVPQPATSNTTSKYTPYAVTHGLFSSWWAWRCPKHVETVVNNQHLQLTINHLYCCILLVFFLHIISICQKEELPEEWKSRSSFKMF